MPSNHPFQVPPMGQRNRYRFDPEQNTYVDEAGIPVAIDTASADLGAGRANAVLPTSSGAMRTLNLNPNPGAPAPAPARRGLSVARPTTMGAGGLPDMSSLTELLERAKMAKGGGMPGPMGVPSRMVQDAAMGNGGRTPGASPLEAIRAGVSSAESGADTTRLGANLGFAGNTIGSAIAGTAPDRSFHRQQLADAERGPSRAREVLEEFRTIQEARAKGEDARAALEAKRAELKQRQDFDAEQARLDREARASEGARNRATSLRAAGLRGARGQGPGGGKAVPAMVVTDIANFQTARGALDELEKAFTDKTGPLSGVAQFIPGTDAAQYTDVQRQTAQVVGQILEGGKLSESDFPRYLDMMPTAGDSEERAMAKIASLRNLIDAKERNQVNTLGASGYSTAGLGGQRPGGNVALDEAPAAGDEMDAAAIQWARDTLRDNPSDERAKEILLLNGVR